MGSSRDHAPSARAATRDPQPALPPLLDIRIECEPAHLERALSILRQELADFGKYDRVGWGWSFRVPWNRESPRFFVRRLNRGLSIRQNRLGGSAEGVAAPVGQQPREEP